MLRSGGEWRKSGRSFPGNNCVEVRLADDNVEVRNSRNPDGPVLRLEPSEWARFVAAIKDGEFG